MTIDEKVEDLEQKLEFASTIQNACKLENIAFLRASNIHRLNVALRLLLNLQQASTKLICQYSL